MKEWKLLRRDLSFYVTGRADVGAADWKTHPWIYPSDWSYQLDREADYFSPRDAGGIPLRAFRPPLGVRYLPSRIAAFGLANWNRYCLTGNAAGRDAFLKIANWFATAHHDGRYEHDIPIPQLASPWISCIAQGEAASVLTRAYRLVGDDAYLETARLVLRPMLETEAVGGVASTLPDGSPFVEEYPGSSIRHVLNGCLYAAIGMSDVCRAGDQRDDHVRTFLRALIAGIGANILAWDSEGWSTYDLSTGSARNLNTMTYHRLQIVMLRYLGEVCDEPRLIAAAQRWERTADDPGRRIRALVGKVRYRIAARW